MDKQLEVIARLKGKRKGGFLERWFLYDYENFFTKDKEQVALGYVKNDGRWRDGTNIRTSAIVEIHEDLNIIETKNTYYEYGIKATEVDKADLLSYVY